jgi:hypothetical protein
MRIAVPFFGRLMVCEVVEFLANNEVTVVLINRAGAPVSGTMFTVPTSEVEVMA